MKKAAMAVVVVVIVLIVVLATIVVVPGLLQKTPLKSKTNYSPSSPEYNSPNVVSSGQVNKSLGGHWAQTTGTTATTSNASSAMAIIEQKGTTTGFASLNGEIALSSYSIMLKSMPMLSPPNYNSPSLNGMTSLEFAIFQPVKGRGISTVGYITEKNTTEVNKMWKILNNSASSSTSSNISVGTANYNAPYIYLYEKFNVEFEPVYLRPFSNMYMNVMVSVYKNDFIIMLHSSTVNTSKSNMTLLLNNELSLLVNPSASPSHPIFISSANLKAQIDINETNYMQMYLGIENASVLFKEFQIGSIIGSGSLDSSENAYINNALGNLTSVGLSVYGNGTGNATLIGLASFSNSYNATIYDAIASNFTKIYSGTLNSNTGIYNGAQYIYLNSSSTTQTNEGTLSINQSLIFFNYNSYLGVIYTSTINGKIVGLHSMKALLSEETALL